MKKTLRVILGDQLSRSISSLQGADVAHDVILMVEVWDEATYVKHHKKKIALIFSAMRHFAQALQDEGFTVAYTLLNDPANTGSFTGEVARAVECYGIEHIVVTYPGEHRVLQAIETWQTVTKQTVELREDERFLCSREAFAAWANHRTQLRMEYFYRQMRQDLGILMDGTQPLGGQWNFDAENRKPPKPDLILPQPYTQEPDALTREVLALVEARFADHFGDLHPFPFAVTRSQALPVLRHFIEERLAQFGDYQDAMLEGEAWMFHSHISFYLNLGLLLPLECVQQAQQAYWDGIAPLNAVEGFIRQIVGWREYVRGIYWLNMPQYADHNFFNATRTLPSLYWGAPTNMNCLRQCVQETKANAYAHHIQRLMVLGNFALLAGVDPKQVNEWFLIVYADAFEWVELPNVTGMILFADGGYLASKPYAAGGAYINKMSNYCQNCHYKVSKKNGDQACPFNYLYWDFLSRNRKKLAGNHRLAMMYKTLDRMSPEKKQAITDDSRRFLDALDD